MRRKNELERKFLDSLLFALANKPWTLFLIALAVGLFVAGIVVGTL